MLATRGRTWSILISRSDVARFFGVSKKIVDRWVKQGKLPKPRRRLGFARWEYRRIVALRKFAKPTESIISTDYPPSPATVPLTWRG